MGRSEGKNVENGPALGRDFDNLTLIHNAMGPIPPACNIPRRHWQKVGQKCRGGIGQVPGFYETHAGAGATSTST